LDRFARDQCESLLRQMFHIQQNSSVIDYVEKFSTIVDQLKAYTNHPDMHTFTTCFVDGLRPEIRTVVAMQRSPDLDTVYSLALLQEEVVNPMTKYEYPRHGTTQGYKPNFRNARPLQQDKVPDAQAVAAKATPTDKLSELRQYRHAQGLYDRCAEKWFRGHKCPPTIQLHAMQELWDLLPFEDSIEYPNEEPTEQILLALSHDAQMGSHGTKTI
jgi:hypothetical protein